MKNALRRGISRLEWEASVLVARLRGAPPPADEAVDVSVGAAARIVVLRLDEIGDVVLSSAFLRELRRFAARARITLVVKPEVEELVALCPHVDEIVTFDPGRGGIHVLAGVRRAARFARSLRRPPVDLAIVPRRDADRQLASAIAFMLGARRRIGFSETAALGKARTNPGLARLLNGFASARPGEHEVESTLAVLRFLEVGPASDALELWLSSDDHAAADALLQPAAGAGRPLVALAPGAGHRRREWPLDRFSELASWLDARGHTPVVVGGAEDRQRGASIRAACPGAIDATGRTTLRQAAALLSRCHVYVGNDTGPMHLAAAAGVPVVEISCHPRSGDPDHSQSPRRFGPWKVESRILQPERPSNGCTSSCSDAAAHCIRQLAFADVRAAVDSILAARAPVQRSV